MRIFDPFAEMEQTLREMQPFLEGLMSRPGAFLPGRYARAYPRLNIREDQENIYVEALAPGIDPGTLQVTAVRNALRIEGEKTATTGVAREDFYVNERAAGKFARAIELPVEVDSERIAANYSNGILTITLPKEEKAKPRQIQVSVNG